MDTFVTFALVAVLIEGIVHIVQNIQEKETSWKYWASLILGIVISVLVAVNWNLDLFKMAGLPEGQIPYVGAVLTGIVLSRGSNYISDLVGVIKR